MHMTYTMHVSTIKLIWELFFNYTCLENIFYTKLV
jgi:hypothetical protein